jgi:hypothetical protein
MIGQIWTLRLPPADPALRALQLWIATPELVDLTPQLQKMQS